MHNTLARRGKRHHTRTSAPRRTEEGRVNPPYTPAAGGRRRGRRERHRSAAGGPASDFISGGSPARLSARSRRATAGPPLAGVLNFPVPNGRRNPPSPPKCLHIAVSTNKGHYIAHGLRFQRFRNSAGGNTVLARDIENIFIRLRGLLIGCGCRPNLTTIVLVSVDRRLRRAEPS